MNIGHAVQCEILAGLIVGTIDILQPIELLGGNTRNLGLVGIKSAEYFRKRGAGCQLAVCPNQMIHLWLNLRIGGAGRLLLHPRLELLPDSGMGAPTGIDAFFVNCVRKDRAADWPFRLAGVKRCQIRGESGDVFIILGGVKGEVIVRESAPAPRLIVRMFEEIVAGEDFFDADPELIGIHWSSPRETVDALSMQCSNITNR